MLALLGASGNALLAQGAAGSVRYSARPQLQPAVLGPTRCLLPSRRPQMVVSAATGPIADTSARVLFASLLPAVAVVSSCLAAMIPTGYNSFVKKHERPDGRSPKLTRRVFTGCLLGAVVSMWIFSGAIGFLAAFAWMAVVAQNEYYFMARQNGVYPTWKLGMLGSLPCRKQGPPPRLGQSGAKQASPVPEHASGRPKLRPASANQPLGPRWPAMSGLFST